MAEYELPLVFFTVLCQWAVGSIVAITLLFILRPTWLNDDRCFNYFRKLAVAILLINTVGSTLSLLHLGSPLGAYRAVLGISHSWLSREVIAFSLLGGMIFVWAIIVFRFNQNRKLVKNVSLLTSVIGLAAILVSAQVYYQMASHPLWHTPLTHLNFIATSLLCGFVTVALIVGIINRRQQQETQCIPGFLPSGIIAAILLSLLVIVCYGFGLNGQGELFKSTAALFSSALFGWFIFAGLITPTAIAVYCYQRPTLSLTSAGIAMLLVLSAAISGRLLFYGSVMSQAPWF